jgi:hypothetical protein
VRDLLGDKRALGDGLPDDGQADGIFDDPSSLIVTPDWAQSSLQAAEQAGQAAMASMAALVPCRPDTGDETCAGQFIQSFGKRAFRRPLEAAERQGLLEVYRVGAADGFASGIELVIEAMLQSPSFLYRLELGQKEGSGPGLVKLTGYEVASRLSYALWGTMPDQGLTDAADGGKLSSTAEINAQARRLLADPRGHAMLVAFHHRWFELTNLDEVMKEPMKYPQFAPSLVASMKGAVGALVEDLLFKGDGHLETMLASPVAYVDANLAPLYGLPVPATAGFQRVSLPAGERVGLLTDVGVLTAHTFADGSAPIHRGKFIRERFLCVSPPAPPANLNVMPPDVPANMTNREALAKHRAEPSCASCHELMDPIGFAFEGYDGLGRFSATEAGRPVDASGSILHSKDLDGAFNGAGELNRKLLGSQEVRDCVAGTFAGFVQSPDLAADSCAMSKLRVAFDAAGHDLKALVLAVTGTDGFQYRRAIAGEVRP